MIRIEKFKQLLRDRIADYQKRYDDNGDKMMFGALQEAKDTLEYIEKQFPSLWAHYGAEPQKVVEIKVNIRNLLPGELMSMQRVGVTTETDDGMLRYEEHLMEKWRFQIIESFFQFLVAERDTVFSWCDDRNMLGAELRVVLPKKNKV